MGRNRQCDNAALVPLMAASFAAGFFAKNALFRSRDRIGSSLKRQRRRPGAGTCNCWSKRMSQCERRSRTCRLPNCPSDFQERRSPTSCSSPASQRTMCTTPDRFNCLSVFKSEPCFRFVFCIRCDADGFPIAFSVLLPTTSSRIAMGIHHHIVSQFSAGGTVPTSIPQNCVCLDNKRRRRISRVLTETRYRNKDTDDVRTKLGFCFDANGCVSL